jgi:cyclophilin family peptidyl-prolyl cis-trans isomerase
MNALKSFLLVCIVAGSWLAADAAPAASSNSMVRFRLSNGIYHVGDIDVELFDHDKPVTVSNFLHYVRSGAYDRSFLHRCVPDFIIQGGLYAVDNPYPSTLFQAMTRIPEGPPIANEFDTGTRIGNNLGTLAMALFSTNIGGIDLPALDSATTSWYFNTADNSDYLDPDYVVFGRVTAGMNVLNFFNALAEEEGIINMFSLNYLFSACDLITIDGDPNNALGALPVSYDYFDCPYYSDLFTVQIIMLDGRDEALPRITITSPAAGGSVTNDAVTITAFVTDNVAVKSVRAYLDSAGPVVAVLDTNNNTWTATLTNLPPGTNTFVLEATDTAGNRSTMTREFIRSVVMPIGLFLGGTSCTEREVVVNLATNLVTSCGGTIAGATNGQLLEIGRSYVLTATPVPGNMFAGWYRLGVLVWQAPTYSIVMETNLALTAVFHTNFFPHVKGTYTGLFFDPNQVEERSSGFVTLTVSALGSYSAKVTINGRTHPMTGTFDSGTGQEVNFLFLSRPLVDESLTFRMTLDLSGGSDHLSGSFSNSYAYGVVTNFMTEVLTTNIVGGMIHVTTNIVAWSGTNYFLGSWTAQLHADRSIFTSANPAPQAGKYTLIIPADPNSTHGPFGDGYGKVSVSPKGILTFSGSLADGTKVSQKVPMSKNGDWPLYLNLYKNKGTLLSRIVFDGNQPNTDFSGLMNWFKRTQAAKYYPGGFTNESMIVGSRFTPPFGTNRLLELTTAVVGFTNGNLMVDFENEVTLDAAGKVTNLDPNRLKLKLNKSSGLMTGSATPPAGRKAMAVKGAVLQKQTRGAGYFLGTNASGRVSLGP